MSSTVYVRRDVSSLGPGDQTLAAYASAVAEMQSRPKADPTSWAFQAAIHGTLDSSPLPGQNQCQHATWFFVSWHRMFLYYFERIVRAAVIGQSGPPDWALPYWNYEAGGANAAIPDAFRTPPTSANPLYVEQRAPGINSGHLLPPQVTSSAYAVTRPAFVGGAEFGGGQTPVLFQQFHGPTGRLEQTPHNDIHMAVGGQTGWMGDPDTAARDPIFWLHHGNIDRLWVLWNRNGNPNPTDPQWASQSFSFFDEHGRTVSLTAAQVLDTVRDLSYTYDQFVSGPPPSSPTPPGAGQPVPAAARLSESLERSPELVASLVQPLQLTGSPASVELIFDQRATRSALTSIGGAPRVLLEIDNIAAERHPGTVYGVYVDLPAEASVEQEAASHVGNLSFFGVERARNPRGDQPPHGLSLTYDITEVARREDADAGWDARSMTITFKPLSLIPPDGEEPANVADEPPATIGGISLYLA
jgi:Common central domain of tyrosinase/Polyphenol oxidase middle domain